MTQSRSVCVLFLPIVAVGLTSYYPRKAERPETIKINKSLSKRTPDDETTLLRIKEKSAAMTDYAAKHNYNNRYCFLIDMKMPSGRNRFLVYTMEAGRIENSALVAH